jgi:hypothetical protein
MVPKGSVDILDRQAPHSNAKGELGRHHDLGLDATGVRGGSGDLGPGQGTI